MSNQNENEGYTAKDGVIVVSIFAGLSIIAYAIYDTSFADVILAYAIPIALTSLLLSLGVFAFSKWNKK